VRSLGRGRCSPLTLSTKWSLAPSSSTLLRIFCAFRAIPGPRKPASALFTDSFLLSPSLIIASPPPLSSILHVLCAPVAILACAVAFPALFFFGWLHFSEVPDECSPVFSSGPCPGLCLPLSHHLISAVFHPLFLPRALALNISDYPAYPPVRSFQHPPSPSLTFLESF